MKITRTRFQQYNTNNKINQETNNKQTKLNKLYNYLFIIIIYNDTNYY